MLVYYTLLLTFLAPLVTLNRVTIKFREKKYWGTSFYTLITFSILFIFSAMREGVGTDYWTYRNSFIDYRQGDFDNNGLNYELGFMIIIDLWSKTTFDSQFMIVLCSLLTVGLYVYAFKRFSENYSLSIFLFYGLYFYFISFNAIRSMLAVAVTLIAIKYLCEKNIFKYMLIIIIATVFFHTSAVIMIPFYFFVNYMSTKKNIFFGGVGLIGVILFYQTIYIFLLGFFPKYHVYYQVHGGSSYLNTLFLMVNLILLIKTNVSTDMEKKYLHVFKTACFAGLCLSACSFLNVLMIRVSLYFYAFSLLSVPFSLNRLTNVKERELTIRCAVAVLVVFIFVKYLISGVAGIGPYRLYEW